MVYGHHMDNVPENKKAPRIISPKRLIVHDTILARFFRDKMDTTWTEHGQHMDRAWTDFYRPPKRSEGKTRLCRIFGGSQTHYIPKGMYRSAPL